MPDTLSVYHRPDLPMLPTAQTDSTGYCTSMFDSVAADTVAGRVPRFVPTEVADSLRREKAIADSIAAIPPPGSESGLYGTARHGGYAHSTALNGLLAVMLFVLLVKGLSVVRALRTYRSELWSIRRRSNVFDDKSAVSLPMAVFLTLVYIVFGGVVLYNCPEAPVAPTLGGALFSMALLGCFYVFERCAVWVVGTTFALPDECRRLMGGFSATESSRVSASSFRPC